MPKELTELTNSKNDHHLLMQMQPKVMHRMLMEITTKETFHLKEMARLLGTKSYFVMASRVF